MMQQGLKHFSEIPLMIFGMLLFFSVYLAVVARTLWSKSNQKKIAVLSNLPLQDEDVVK